MVKSHQFDFPILWFIYFFTPILILLNAIQQLWHHRTIHLRGQKISPHNFVVVNLLLIALNTTIYLLVSFVILLFFEKILKLVPLYFGNLNGILAYIGLFCTNWLGVNLLSLIQELFNLITSYLGLVIPAILLIATAYSSFKLNPLGVLMISRIDQGNIWIGMTILISSNFIVIFVYVLLNKFGL